METHDEEGRIALISENQMCELLGVREKEHIIVPTEVFDRRMDEQGDYDGAAIPTSDTVLSEVVISYDKNNPPMIVLRIFWHIVMSRIFFSWIKITAVVAQPCSVFE